MKHIKFNIFGDYSDIITHGLTERELDFMHTDLNSDTFKNSKATLSRELKVMERDLYFINQVHDKNIRIINEASINNVEDYDGLITNVPGKVLCTCYADCVPLLFFDTANNVVASVHSGWKGTIKLIGQETVLKMKHEYNSKPEDILVGIGPSIGPCCFEVQEDTYDQFRRKLPIGAFEDEGKLFVDLWNSNIYMLTQIGIKRENIECKGICTSCHSSRFYSYRKGDKESGRFTAFIIISNELCIEFSKKFLRFP